jgi:hypothetical protein
MFSNNDGIFQQFLNQQSQDKQANLLTHKNRIVNQALFNLRLQHKLVLSQEDQQLLLAELNRIVYCSEQTIPIFQILPLKYPLRTILQKLR